MVSVTGLALADGLGTSQKPSAAKGICTSTRLLSSPGVHVSTAVSGHSDVDADASLAASFAPGASESDTAVHLKRQPCHRSEKQHRGLDRRVALEGSPPVVVPDSAPVPERGSLSPVTTVAPSATTSPSPKPGAEPPAPATDTTPPQTSIVGGPAKTTASTSATLSFASTESESSFICKLDNTVWSTCEPPEDYSGLTPGTHQFFVLAIDEAGNADPSPAVKTWTIETTSPPPADTTPPQTSIVSGPAASTTSTSASFRLSSSEPGSGFECKLDNDDWAACTSPKAYSGLSVGTHSFSTRASDTGGNVDATPATYSWTVDEQSTSPPPPPPEECTTVVDDLASAEEAVAAAPEASVVCLADGSYAKLTLNATKAAPGVTLQAEHPAGATIAGASLSGAHLTVARFVFTSSVQVQPGAKSITIEHNRVTGGGQGIDAGPTTTTSIDDLAIIGNQLIGPFGEDAIHLNRYHDGDGDGTGVLIEGNEITNVRENGNHSDCLQTVWVGDHIVFRKNYLHDNRCQGFFVKDQASLSGGVTGPVNVIKVEDNLFLRNREPCGAPATSCGQPMYFQIVGPYTGFVMKRNTIWGDGTDSIAAFRDGTGADTLIEDNVIYRLWTDTNMSPAALRDNTICKRETSTGGSWSTPTGETVSCGLSFPNATADDYRLAGDRGVDWTPAEQQYGP
jgi:hypothetical protein